MNTIDDNSHENLAADQPPYKTAFPTWNKNGWFRQSEIDYDLPEEGQKVYSPHVLFPLLNHPDMVERGKQFIRELLTQRFLQYAEFTTVLEREVVNPAVTLLAQGHAGVDIPHAMKRDAGKILTDESFHGLESDRIYDSTVAFTGIVPCDLGRPRFLVNLDRFLEGKAKEEKKLLHLGFATVSETLISGILADIPKNPTVVTQVREYVQHHAIDEGRHHAFFASFIARQWEQLSRREQD